MRGSMHDNGNSFGMRLLCRGRDFLFDDVLNVLIDGRDQVRAGQHGLLHAVEAAARERPS